LLLLLFFFFENLVDFGEGEHGSSLKSRAQGLSSLPFGDGSAFESREGESGSKETILDDVVGGITFDHATSIFSIKVAISDGDSFSESVSNETVGSHILRSNKGDGPEVDEAETVGFIADSTSLDHPFLGFNDKVLSGLVELAPVGLSGDPFGIRRDGDGLSVEEKSISGKIVEGIVFNSNSDGSNVGHGFGFNELSVVLELRRRDQSISVSSNSVKVESRSIESNNVRVSNNVSSCSLELHEDVQDVLEDGEFRNSNINFTSEIKSEIVRSRSKVGNESSGSGKALRIEFSGANTFSRSEELLTSKIGIGSVIEIKMNKVVLNGNLMEKFKAGNI